MNMLDDEESGNDPNKIDRGKVQGHEVVDEDEIDSQWGFRATVGNFFAEKFSAAKLKRRELVSKFVEMERQRRQASVLKKEEATNKFIAEARDDLVFVNREERNCSENDREELSSDAVGKVTVTDAKVRRCQNMHQAYIRVGVESERQISECIESLSSSGFGEWKQAFEFDITDAGCDVAVKLYGQQYRDLVLSQKHIGTVIIPLSLIYQGANTLDLIGISPLSTRNHRFNFSSWFKVYPINEALVHFEPGLNGFHRKGKISCPNAVCEIHLKIEVQLLRGSLIWCCAMNPPYRPIECAVEDRIALRRIKYSTSRIKALANSTGKMLLILQEIRRWKYPSVSASSLVTFSYATLAAPKWQYPILITCFAVFIQFAFPRKAVDLSQHLWEDVGENDTELKQGLKAKVGAMWRVLLGIQKRIDSAAHLLERATNATNWADPVTTIVNSVLLLFLGVSASCIFWLLQLFFSRVIPLNLCLFAIGMIGLSPIQHRRLAKKLGKIKRLDFPKSSRFLRNILLRIPDEPELIHRRIAQTQILHGNLDDDNDPTLAD